MARNVHGTHSDLIHCANCGEDYSSTYKRCPFCGARPAPSQGTGRLDFTNRLGDLGGRAAGGSRSSPSRSASRSRQEIDEDDYVFDGQDVFDDLDDDRGRGPSSFRGGRHLADDGEGISPTTIIGFVVSGIIVLAAILIVILVILPMIRGGQTDTVSNSPNTQLPTEPNTTQSQPVSPSPLPANPTDPVTPTDPVVSPTDPVVPSDDPLAPTNSPAPIDPVVSPSPSSSPSVPPASGGSLTLTYRGQTRTELTISDEWPAPIQLQASGASGTVTWKSDNASVATVNAEGLITGVSWGDTYVTATDSAGKSQSCHVIVRLSKTSTPSAPATSTSPAPSTSQTPSSGSLSLSTTDFTMSAAYPTPVTIRASGASGTVTWSSSNSAVATVDANGKVSMVGKGQCTITATDSAGQRATCIVRCS